MGLAWQQGPLAPGAAGRFLVPDPLPGRLLYAEPLRRRMRVRFGGAWIADSEDVTLLHEPGRYPVAYFPAGDIADGVLEPAGHTTRHQGLGITSWYTVRAGTQSKPRAAWQHTDLPGYASELTGRIAFAWPAMDAFYEEDERIVGHAADAYHRIDIRQTSRHLLVRDQDRVIADTRRPLALYESGFAPRWYVPRADLDETALTAAEGQTFCPYKGLASYYDIADARRAAWSYDNAWPEVGRVRGLISFEPDKIEVHLDGTRLRLEPGQAVIAHGPDRDLSLAEVAPGRRAELANDPTAGPDPIALSPAIGPVPAIYVPLSAGRPAGPGLLWRAGARAARLARGWAVQHPTDRKVNDREVAKINPARHSAGPAIRRTGRAHLWPGRHNNPGRTR